MGKTQQARKNENQIVRRAKVKKKAKKDLKCCQSTLNLQIE